MHSRPSATSEGKLIRQIERIMRFRGDPSAEVSIGDDAAVFKPEPKQRILVSSDALVEHVHFDLRYFLPHDLGWKALAVNLSDIAAMGGLPLYFTTSIALPLALPRRFVAEFYRGMARLARVHRVALIGGDTCFSPHDLFIDITILGAVLGPRQVTRSQAKAGDCIFVTGELGGSAMGLELLRKFGRKGRSRALARRHLRPEPRCRIGRHLAEHRLASAMIDVSDGLSTDLNHLCAQSGVGAEIWRPELPVARVLKEHRKLLSGDPIEFCLHGGEDYELLFTVPSRLRRRIPAMLFGVPIHHIGIVTKDRNVWLLDSSARTRFHPGGFDHFSRSGPHRS